MRERKKETCWLNQFFKMTEEKKVERQGGVLGGDEFEFIKQS